MAMTRFLTWNIQSKHTPIRQQVLEALVQEHAFDVIVFQEASGLPLTIELNKLGYEPVQLAGTDPVGTVRIFLKKNTFQQLSLTHTHDKDKKIVMVELRRYTSKAASFNVAAVHLYSKKGRSEREQLWRNHQLLLELHEWEKNVSTTNRTILVGDFNANPYEANLRDPFLLRGQESRALIKQLQGPPLPISQWIRSALDFWYNPMWHLLGDHEPVTAPSPLATARVVTGSFYFYNEGETPFWNLYDGFMVRPALMEEVVHSALRVLVQTGPTPYFSPSPITDFLQPYVTGPKNSPILTELPDHLPVTFALTSL
ncbi:MAG: hypothetical protein JWP58_3133 [Hymenobacter sp.]|nr:hypothetical protein [Hymenobacter sp.]